MKLHSSHYPACRSLLAVAGALRPWLLVALASCCLWQAGCSSRRKEEATERETSHLKPLVILYGQFLSQNGKPPTNEEQFKKFIHVRGKRLLENSGIATVDEMFISERDGQPYVVLYGKPKPETPRDLVAYEQTGLDGVRRVGYSLGLISDMDEAKFQELMPK